MSTVIDPSRFFSREQVLSLLNMAMGPFHLHNKEVPVPTSIVLFKVINGVPIVGIVVSNPNHTMSFIVFQPACTPRPTFQFDVRLFFEQGYDFVCRCSHVQFLPVAHFDSHIWNSNKCTSNYVFKSLSSTIRQHVFPKTQILYTTYSQTNSWNHLFSSSLTNTRANVWSARCHQGNGNIVVQRLVHLSKLRASAPS